MRERVLREPATAEGVATRRTILHVINMGTTCGGAERLVADTVAAQRAAGHRVHVLSSDLAGSGTRFSDATWHQPAGRSGLAARFAGQFRNTAARAALAAAVAEWRPDVVHLHTVGLLAPATLDVLADVPTVLTVHGPELFLRATERWCLPARYFRVRGSDDPARAALTWRGRAVATGTSWLVGRLWRRGLRVVDVYTAPSRYLADLAGTEIGPVRLVPNGFDRVEVAPPAPAPGPRRLLFVGRLEYFKGPQVLLAALPAVLERHPGTVLTICGTGSMDREVRDQIDRLGLGRSVEVAGWLRRDELARRVAGADLVVMPSLWPEAFGLTCLEALAAGTPVVASDVGGLPDLVEPGVTGELVPPGDPVALAGAIDRLLGDDERRERLGRAGRRRAAGYTVAAHLAGVEDAYTEAIEERSGRPARRPGAHAAGRPTGRPARPAGSRPASHAAIRPAGHAASGPAGQAAARVRALLDDSLLRNSALLLLATVELAAGGFLFWQIVAHLFTPEEVGRAGALISASTLVANLALLGMNNSLIHYLPWWPDRARTVNAGLTVALGAALVGAAGFVAAVPVFAPRLTGVRQPGEAAAFIALTVAAAAGLFFDNVFIALRSNGYLLRRNTLVVAVRLALPAVLAGAGAVGIFTSYWLALTLALPLYVRTLRSRFGLPPRLTLATDRLRVMWRYSAGNYLATAILLMPSLLMPVLVAQRVDPGHAALYYIASLIASVLSFVPQATCRSFFAEVAHDGRRLPNLLPRVLGVTLGLQVPLLAGIAVAGRPVLRLFGPVYTQAYPLLLVLALTTALSSVGFVGSTLLLISGRVRLLCQLSATACAISLLGAYLLAGRGLIWIGGSVLTGEAVLAAGYCAVIGAALRAPTRRAPTRRGGGTR
jgi:glycosyltransferase involved in cell wall biosynthesis/O-antigen/teichoic acid export membrane protein